MYTIGLGADVDEATLRTIAGDDERYYFAPDSGDLARIYGEIAQGPHVPRGGLVGWSVARRAASYNGLFVNQWRRTAPDQ